MAGEGKTRELLAEIAALRKRVADLEAACAEDQPAREALRESEARYRRLIEVSPDAVLMADLDGQILFASPQMACLLGLPDEGEFCGRNVADCVIESDRQRLAANIPRLVESGVRRGTEYTALRRDGSTVPVEVSSAVVPDAAGQPKAVMAVVRDVSRRKEAEEALRASEERFRLAFEEAPVGMIIGVEDGVIARVNQALCRISGYTPEELIGRHVREFQHPEDRDLSLPFLKRLFAGEITSFSLERRYVAKGGRVFWAQATTSAARNPDGTLAFALGVLEDITDRKLARDALLRERQTLRHMLRASDHERQLIAYEIHDGLAQELAAALMQLQSYEHLESNQPEEAGTAFAAGMQMLRQAHFEARRLISGVRPPVLDEAGIVAALSHLIHDQRTPGGPEIQFRSRVSFDRLPAVLENAVYRIAQEALINACKHSRADRVKVSLVQDRDRVRLEVRDSGVGFDPAAVDGDRFGLEGIRQRTRLLGGRMSVASRPAGGTRVRVVLPLVEPELPPDVEQG